MTLRLKDVVFVDGNQNARSKCLDDDHPNKEMSNMVVITRTDQVAYPIGASKHSSDRLWYQPYLEADD